MKFARRITVFAIAVFIGLAVIATPQDANAAEVECQSWYELPGECLSASTVDYIAEQNQELRQMEDRTYAAEQYARDRDSYWSQQMNQQAQDMQFTIDSWRDEANLRFSKFDELMAAKMASENRLNQRISKLVYKISQKNDLIRQLKLELRQAS